MSGACSWPPFHPVLVVITSGSHEPLDAPDDLSKQVLSQLALGQPGERHAQMGSRRGAADQWHRRPTGPGAAESRWRSRTPASSASWHDCSAMIGLPRLDRALGVVAEQAAEDI